MAGVASILWEMSVKELDFPTNRSTTVPIGAIFIDFKDIVMLNWFSFAQSEING